MLNGRATSRIATAALLITSTALFAAEPVKLSGSIAGIVRDARGIPQMGASVLLFNKYEKLLQTAFTNERGTFGFETLTPDLYSVRVSLANFMPAMKHKIAVQPGMQSLLYINLASVLSSVELVYAAPGQGALMSDDWKWTLKTAASTRPILRFGPDVSISDPGDPRRSSSSIFSDTRGMLKVSAGDPGTLSTATGEADLGTAFALATSLFGRNQLQVSGGVGYTSRSGMPATGFRTTYSRDGIGPEVTVTMRQVYLPTRASAAMAMGQADGLPALRSMSVGLTDHAAITDSLRLDYGVSLDTVSFIDHLNYFSPFARLTYDLGNWGTVQFAYSSGAPATALVSDSSASAAVETGSDMMALSQNLAMLGSLPRVSILDGRAKVQRTQNFELGYEKRFATRTFNVSGFREVVSNGALTLIGPDDLFAGGDILPDISTSSGIVNIGGFSRYGYAASVTQELGDNLEAGASAGHAGALAITDSLLSTATADDLRSKIRDEQRYWVSARASAKLPVTGTQISTSYQWADYSALIPAHLYITQRSYAEPGLNIHVRQPIPAFGGLPGRLEATADLRNMLAQGYLSLNADGRRVLLMQAPRMVRGGLSFIF